MKLKHDQLTPVLRQLHWLLIQQRVKYILKMFVFKIRETGQPGYLTLVVKSKDNARPLKTSDGDLYCLHRRRRDQVRLSTRKRSPYLFQPSGIPYICLASPTIWNSQPCALRRPKALTIICRSFRKHVTKCFSYICFFLHN